MKNVCMRPCKIQCTFNCHCVDNIIAPLFVYVGPGKVGKEGKVGKVVKVVKVVKVGKS